MSGEPVALVDASVFIRLARIDEVSLLRGLSPEPVIPVTVDQEITEDPAAAALEAVVAEPPRWLRIAGHPDEEHIERAASHLGRGVDPKNHNGDVMLLAHALSADEPVVLTDDKPLRKTCKALSIPVSGSIGVLIRAVEREDIDAGEAKDALYAMDEVGARLSASLVKRAEQMIDEAAGD